VIRFWPNSALLLGAAVLVLVGYALAAEQKEDSRYPFRTDFANANLPWYQPKPGEFPPHHSDRRIGGELVTADFIHRTGQFRMSKTGELVDFTMPPYGSVNYLNTDADLRDVPLGTFFLFFLNQDTTGNFTRLATMQDQFTMDAGHGFNYRLDGVNLAEGKLSTTKQSLAKNQPDLGKKELLVADRTRVWKGDKQVKLADLAVGDQLLFNFTGKTATDPGHCTDIWIGADTQKLATETEHKKFTAFVKARGLPGWVDRVEGDKLTVTLFTGDPGAFKQTWLGEFEAGKEIKVVVANDELRTWNPGVDNEKSNLLEVQKTGVDAYGTSGVRLVFTVAHLLEGFRKGHIVRIFGPGWPLKDQFYGESLMGYGYAGLRDSELVENVAREYPLQFPFRTDYGNPNLPWYQVQPGVVPPAFSDHLVLGELVKADPASRSGQFRADRTGELVDFTIIPQGSVVHEVTSHRDDNGPARFQDVAASVRYLNAGADLSDIPLGTRCRFHLYQDEKGAFARASLVTDEFSFLALNMVTYRIEETNLDTGILTVARQIPEVKNYNGDMEQPPDIGRTQLRITPDTRIWKGNGLVRAADLSVGDSLLINVTSEQAGDPSHCTDVWVGAETQRAATQQQEQKKHLPAKH
jgi:hypothetical protein